MEFGSAAAVARWTGQGKQVTYVMVSSGEAGIDGMDPAECKVVREAEQIESARIVGVDTVEFLGFQDGVIEYGLPLRAAIAKVVRRYQPEIVLTGNFRDTFFGNMINQADHIAVGRAVLDGVRDAGNRGVFNDQTGRRARAVEPAASRPNSIWAGGLNATGPATESTRADTFDAPASPPWPPQKAVQSTVSGVRENFDPREFLEGFGRMLGQRMGTQFATGFERSTR